MLYTQLVRTDVAQRREREARLLTGDAIVAAMAHEVRQPLFAMVAYANADLHLITPARILRKQRWYSNRSALVTVARKQSSKEFG
jgi:hypothetical protein